MDIHRTPRQDEAMTAISIFPDHLSLMDAWRDETEGITLIGRANVEVLRLNRARQTAARKQWMQSGLYPS
jgi:hypothetical protein